MDSNLVIRYSFTIQLLYFFIHILHLKEGEVRIMKMF